MAKLLFCDARINETTNSSYNNPWTSDRSLGSVHTVLQLAQASGHRQQVSMFDNEENLHSAYECAPSLRMISALREIKNRRQQLEKVNFETQQHLRDRETKDLTNTETLEQRITKIKELNSHLEEVIRQKQLLISRLQQPFVNDYMRLELPYQKYASDLLPRLVPVLSELPSQLDNLEWASHVNATIGDLGGLLADVAATIGTQHLVCQRMIQVRQSMQQLQQHRSGSTVVTTH